MGVARLDRGQPGKQENQLLAVNLGLNSRCCKSGRRWKGRFRQDSCRPRVCMAVPLRSFGSGWPTQRGALWSWGVWRTEEASLPHAPLPTRSSVGARRTAGVPEGARAGSLKGLTSSSLRAGAADASGLQAQQTSRRAPTAGGVAASGVRAGKLLVATSACRDSAKEARRACQTLPDCVEGRSEAQSGTRSGPFR